MELNDINIFIELYNNRSISKTAEKLNYTQSNISMRLMKLEQEFNIQLFARTKSGLKTLKDTERFYYYAKKIEADLQELYQEFSLPSHEMFIGSTQLLSRLYFPSLLFSEKKNIVSLHTSTSKKLYRDFNNHIYDLILTHTKLEVPSNTICYKKSESLSWVSSISLTNTTTAELSIVINRDKSCPLRKLSLEALHLVDYSYQIIEVDTLDLMLSLLHTSNCIALLPLTLSSTYKDLTSYNLLPSKMIEIFLYCTANFDKEILDKYFLIPFSFHEYNMQKND